jgi:hypothetical protein
MAISYAARRAALSSVVALCSIAFALQLVSIAEAGNYNKAQCRLVKSTSGSVKGLAAINGAAGSVCVCPSSQSAHERRQRQPGASSVQTCDIQTPQVVTNFNRPPGTPPGTPPGEPPGEPPTGLLGFNPGNHKNVGKATETPPGKTAPATASNFGVDLNSPADNGNCCAGGDKGRSNGS